MNKSTANFCILLLLALLMIVIGVLREPDIDHELHALLGGSADQQWTAIARDVMEEFSKQSPQLASWSINMTESKARIRIYIFDSEHVDASKAKFFRNNCRYLGDGRSIICDVSIFRSLLKRFDLDKQLISEFDSNGVVVRKYISANEPKAIERNYKFFMLWALGHELGHLAHNHRGRIYFQQHAFEEAIPVETYCHKIELEADGYLLSLFPASKGGYDDLYYFLYGLVNLEITRQACPGHPLVDPCKNILPGTGLAISTKRLEYATDKSHPDYIIRLLRLLDIIQEREDFGILAYQARQLVNSKLTKLPSKEVYARSCNLK